MNDNAENSDIYRNGVRDGKLDLLEHLQAEHTDRLDHHERRLALIEKIIYGMVGALFLAEFMPTLRALING